MNEGYNDDSAIIPSANQELIERSGVGNLLAQIRPQWQAKDLIQRVVRLLPIDPSSACQRLFNASIHDLREKIVIAGIDIAAEAARQNKLPPVTKPEDIEEYSVARTIDLAYRMGLLKHGEWRRMLRVYDIRRDLEHEDDEYEAGIEDCVYIFKTCVDVVLSQDPIKLLKLTDVKEIVEEPTPTALSESLLEDYQRAPSTRQLEIFKFLLSTALNEAHPDIVRQNSYNALGALRDLTQKSVILEVSNQFIERLERRAPTLLEARVAYAAGILPYLKKSQLKTFFTAIFEQMKKTGYTFRSHASHGELLRNFSEIGGLTYCPDYILDEILEWLILCYIGEPGGYGQGRDRRVFYSNVGAPLALEIIKNCGKSVKNNVDKLAKSSKKIDTACKDEFVARRFQTILDNLHE
ncbi:MAG: hypothetical protein ACOY16_00215 [Chloroflexota bacterium]